MDKGCIDSVSQKVLEFFTDCMVKRDEKTIQHITIKDMLTMTAPYKYKCNPYTKYFTSMDWVKFSLDVLGGRGHIGEFRYAPIVGPDILSGILVRATGQSVFDFAKENLFAPLGITIEKTIAPSFIRGQRTESNLLKNMSSRFLRRNLLRSNRESRNHNRKG